MALATTLPPGKPRPPDLRDGSRFVRIDDVPIVDVLERTITRQDARGNPYRVTERLDEQQLRTLLANTRRREASGEFGPIFLGHTTDDDPETDQPPIVGYLADYKEGRHNGNPAILASMYLDRVACGRLKYHGEPLSPEVVAEQFPRRSGEIVAMEKPHGYIDSVALLKRTPQRPLGLVSHLHHSDAVSRFMCPACTEKKGKPMAASEASVALIKRTLGLLTNLIEHAVSPETSSGGGNETVGPSVGPSPTPPSVGTSEPGPDLPVQGGGGTSPDAPAEPPPPPSAEAPPPPDPGAPSADDVDGDGIPDDDEDENGDHIPDGHEQTDRYGSPEGPSPDRFCKSCGSQYHTTDTHHLHHPSQENREVERERARLAAGGGAAGMPSDVSAYPPTFPEKKKEPSRMATQDQERMRRDQENIEVSRLRQSNEEMATRMKALEDEVAESKRVARLSSIESRVIQLEAEGYELDRSEEVDRLSKFTDADVENEISRMRKHYRQGARRSSPVGAGLLPVGGGLGGNGLARPTLNLRDLSTPPEEDEVPGGQGARLWGDSYYRMTLQAEEEGQPIVTRGNATPLQIAKAATRRFAAARSEVTHS